MGHANTPPQIPDVTDEAGDSPKWVPYLGIALFVLSVGWIVWRHSGSEAPDTAAEVPAVADQAAQ